MELSKILDRFAEGLVFVDTNTNFITVGNRKRDRNTGDWQDGITFLPGIGTLKEPRLVTEIVEWWKNEYPKDFNPLGAIATNAIFTKIKKSNKCDLVLSSDGSELEHPEWAIEVKRFQFCGNNGKKNDYIAQKLLSPYLKDRSLIHDIDRLRKAPLGKRRAVIGYCFNYSFKQLDKLEKLHPNHKSFIDNVRDEVCKSNNSETGEINIRDLVDFANEIFVSKGIVRNLEVKDFYEATRHPCGGDGTVFGWEIETTI